MSSLKNPTLRRRTKELSECAEDARECQLLGYELKDLGSLLVKMAIHMEDLQRKVDSQAEYIKTLNEDRKTEPQYDFGEYADRLWKIAYERGKREALEQTEPSCDTCKLKDTTKWCDNQVVCRAYKPKDEPSDSEKPNNCKTCKNWDIVNDHCYFIQECRYEPKTEPQTERSSE